MARALGRYELLRPLARGGMAEVYLARRRAAGIEKWLVVKRMRPERSGDVRFLDLFVREARLSMSLVHQNIVPVFDFGRIDDQVFLAMERVEGKDLGSSLARARSHRLSPLLAAFIAAECCQALDYAHQRKGPDGVALGIVHRDVTPRNVLLSWSGEVKLTDFGIAALAGDAASRLLGTPQYMAPEQARSEPIDPRADVYAIGLVLREAVTGIRPRPGTDRDAILDAARRGELLPWSHVAPPDAAAAGPQVALGSSDLAPPADAPAPLPAALVAIIDRATAARPEDRYADARSLLEELDGFIVGQRAAQKGESPARQLATWLATIWEGARDDVETDATIDGGDLVSFIDDGALDVIGTGTVRSLAATAADDAPAGPTVTPPVAVSPAPGSPSTVPASIASPIIAGATVLPAGRTAELAARSTKISSSNTTVASGTFHTLPLASSHAAAQRSAEVAVRRPRSRQIAPFASLLFVGLAAGAIVFFLMNHYRDPGQPSTDQPSTPQPNTPQPSTVPPSTSQPTAGLPSTAQPSTGQPSVGPSQPGQPSSGQSTSGQSSSGQSSSGQSSSGQSSSGQSSSGQSHTGPPSVRQPSAGPPHTGQPTIGRSGSGQTNPGAEHDGSGSVATAPQEGSDQGNPAVCRVRINLTPWAYYTADGSSTRHETPSTIELAPGPHRLHVWNPELHVDRDITINVPADQETMTYSEPLQPSTLPPGAPQPQ